MELRQPGAAEIVPCLDRVLATRSLQDRPDKPGPEPLWATLMRRNLDVFLFKGRTRREMDKSGSIGGELCDPGWLGNMLRSASRFASRRRAMAAVSGARPSGSKCDRCGQPGALTYPMAIVAEWHRAKAAAAEYGALSRRCDVSRADISRWIYQQHYVE